jgi:hypothetical protein
MGSNWYAKQGLNSFDEVVAYYNGTTPIRGTRASEDLRPLAERRYWWNRIYKASDNKYVLCDGHWAFSSGLGNGTDDDVRVQTAPIVWERREDGDYMTVRSHMNDGISVSRYTFLDRWLPKCMRFDWYTTTGKHFIKHTHARGYSEYYVPKFKGKMDWSARTFEMIEDNKLVFKHTADVFERVGDLVPMQTRRIDKNLDAHYKPKMKEMWEWMQIVLPVMGDRLGDAKNQYAEALTEGRASYWYWDRYVNKDLIREILDDPEHDKRMALAGILAYKADAISGGRFEPSKDSYAKFRACLRKTGGMLAVELR